MKYMSLKEFKESGLLQEINRTILHPMGLAISLCKESDGTYKFDGIWDKRDDPVGIIFDLANSDEERLERFRQNYKKVGEMAWSKIREREKALGTNIESIPGLGPAYL